MRKKKKRTITLYDVAVVVCTNRKLINARSSVEMIYRETHICVVLLFWISTTTTIKSYIFIYEIFVLI